MYLPGWPPKAGPLLQQIAEVEQASEAGNRLVHASEGFAQAQARAIPPRALREAIINGIVHRDWLSRQPTTVEHVGDTLVVTSPRGFIGGIAPSNIITHPPTLHACPGSCRTGDRAIRWFVVDDNGN